MIVVTIVDFMSFWDRCQVSSHGRWCGAELCGKRQDYQKRLFDDIFIQPAAGDRGARVRPLAAHHTVFWTERNPAPTMDAMQGAFLGPEYSAIDIELMARKNKAVYHKYTSFTQLVDEVADLLASGQGVVMQGYGIRTARARQPQYPGRCP